jgi:hypothetical protein
MRTSSLALLLPLAACGQGKQEAARAAEQRKVEAAPTFFCAQGQAELVAQCTVDREQTAAGLVLTLRHPDGHFRRLLVMKDGRGVIAADGAEPATVTPTDADQIDVTIGDDRYRLPATIRQ